MLKIVVKGTELYDERSNEFIVTKDTVLCLEHSLISLSKWESKWHKPFLGKQEKTSEEMIDYIRCMTLTQSYDPNVLRSLSASNYAEIKAYMEDPMSATWFNEKNNPKSQQKTVTAELIYYWMITSQIPFECEKWHLNRLLTLIRVCNIENSPKKKMRKNDVLRQNSRLNAERRRLMGSAG